jgi:hypothetical protein
VLWCRWYGAPFRAKTVGVGQGFVRGLSICSIHHIPALAVCRLVFLGNALLLELSSVIALDFLIVPKHRRRRIVLHRIDIWIQLFSAQKHTRRTLEAVVVEIERVARVRGTVETAVPRAEQVGVRASGVGGEVDDTHVCLEGAEAGS